MTDFEKEVNELLEQAMKQPGVAEVVELYASQQPAIQAHERAQEALAPRWVISSSTSSAKQSF